MNPLMNLVIYQVQQKLRHHLHNLNRMMQNYQVVHESVKIGVLHALW
jgi:hypothetical protein